MKIGAFLKKGTKKKPLLCNFEQKGLLVVRKLSTNYENQKISVKIGCILWDCMV